MLDFLAQFVLSGNLTLFCFLAFVCWAVWKVMHLLEDDIHKFAQEKAEREYQLLHRPDDKHRSYKPLNPADYVQVEEPTQSFKEV